MRIELKLRSPLPFPISTCPFYCTENVEVLESKRPWGAKEKIVLSCLNILHFIRNWLESAMRNQFPFPGPKAPQSEVDI